MGATAVLNALLVNSLVFKRLDKVGTKINQIQLVDEETQVHRSKNCPGLNNRKVESLFNR